MKTPKISLLALFVFIGSFVHAQETIKFIKTTPWTIGVGFNVIDDNGYRFSHFLELRKSWNIIPCPSVLSVEKGFAYGISADVLASINQMNEGKIIDGRKNPTTSIYFSFDGLAKYDFSSLVDNSNWWFKPNVFMGVGYSHTGIPSAKNTTGGAVSFDLGAGVSYMFDSGLGFNFQSIAKFVGPSASDHMEHSIMVIYQFVNTGNSGTKKVRATID